MGFSIINMDDFISLVAVTDNEGPTNQTMTPI